MDFVTVFWICAAIYVIAPLVLMSFQKPSKYDQLFDRESDKQMKRIDLNLKRREQGLRDIPEPRALIKFTDEESKEQIKMLKDMGLWPEAPDGEGGVWFNEPWTRCRKPNPNGYHPGVISGWEKTYWKFDPKKYNL